MTFNKKLLAATLLTAGGFAAISSANAATSDEFAVQMTVESVCDITAGSAIDLALGAADNTVKTGTNSIEVFCSKDTPYQLALTPGNVDTGGLGVLSIAGSAAGAETIGYKLTQGTTGTAWGNVVSTNTLASQGSGAYIANSHDVTLTTTSSTDVPIGTYTDTVTIGLTF